MEAILIPVKRLSAAKARLSSLLDAAGRRRLALAMLGDVLRATEKWEHRLVVTSDREAEAVALAFGCRLVGDPGRGLNAALSVGTQGAVALGAAALLTLPADVPLVRADDVRSLFASHAQVAVAAAADGGTAALLRRPPAIIPTRFGPASAVAHCDEARRRGLVARTLELPSLTLDVDEPDDVELLARSPGERESVHVARMLLHG
ncbi:MAG: 2-phospho-L-lactate guanylyltransferase [Actinomycetota bacterium]